jgi:hypothetical protein
MISSEEQEKLQIESNTIISNLKSNLKIIKDLIEFNSNCSLSDLDSKKTNNMTIAIPK